MTAQATDKLYYKTEIYYLATEPLSTYLAKHKGIDISKMSNKHSTGCWRGYIGSWIIEDDKLYLMGLCDAWGGNGISIGTLFPGEQKVFAEWFSGEIRTPCGELKMYVGSPRKLVELFKRYNFVEWKQATNYYYQRVY